MNTKTKILAIIPARGGSKGLPGKNIKVICGKPLIAYTIDVALNSKLVDKVVVSTEDDEIARISKEYGAEVVLRPEELAMDNSSVAEVIFQVVNWFAEKDQHYDIIVLLEPTSPLRKENDIDNAIDQFIRNMDTADSLVSLGEVQLENPYITKKIEGGRVVPLIDIDPGIYRRQQLPKAYFPYGVIYMTKLSSFKKHRTFYQKNTMPYLIERWQNYEIDDMYDFLCVEAILRHRLGSKKD